MSHNKKLKLFDDDDDNDKDGDLDSKAIESAFDKALKKKHFQGEKGRVLFELQKSINNSDHRFTLDSKFKNDVSYRKLPQSIKEATSKYSQSKDYSYNMMNTPQTQNEEIKTERNKNLSILSTLLTNTEYLNHKPKESNAKKLMIKRYDPQLNLGDSGAKLIKEEEAEPRIIREDNVIKLDKGVEVFKAPLPNPYLTSKYKHKELKKREKEKMMREKMNEVNDHMNVEVHVDYDKLKATIKSKATSFNLFGGDEQKVEPKKEEEVPLVNDKDSIKTEEIGAKKRTLAIAKKELTEKEKTKRFLRNKTKREKKKEKQKSIKQKEKEAEQQLNNEYESLIQEQYGSDKGKDYLRYINMIKQKKSKQTH